MKSIIARIFPFVLWFKESNRATLRADIISGLTVALVLIPQSMAYAQLAGLPSYYGLYAAFLPPMVASLFGSSRQLATGPVAVVSLMTSASLAPLAPMGSAGYVAYAIILALTVGLFQFALGILRLGLVVNFLSHPVVNGFTNGAAIIIATSQLSKLFGVTVDNAEHHYETIYLVLKSATFYTHWPTLLMGILAFGIMYGLKRLNPRIPYVLVAVIVTIVISWATGFETNYRASLSDMESEEAKELVREFNTKVKRVDELGNKRAELTPKLMQARSTDAGNFIGIIGLEHEIAVLNAEINEVSEECNELRENLRLMLFKAVEDGEEGGLRFYPKGMEPSGSKIKGGTWRMKVSNSVIDEESILMIGGGAVVGVIPKGLPKLSVPRPKISDIITLLPYAVIISLLGFMEAVSIAKAMAAKTGQFLDPNQELIGQGLSNMIGAIGQSYPVSGSFSRSAVNLQAGAFSGLSSVITSLMVVVVLVFFTPLLYHLPQATLAAVIMMAVVGLISISSFVHAWRTHRVDGFIQIITFISTLVFAPHLHRGILIGVGIALGIFIYNSMQPGMAHLSLHPDQSYRDAEHWSLQECRHIAMIRYDGNLFFANASYFENLVMDRINNMPELRHILLVANGINDMDASGEDVLSLIVDNVRSAGIDFSMSGVKESVLELMKRTHLYEKIGEDHIYPTQVMAISKIFDKAHRGSDEGQCPLLKVTFLPGKDDTRNKGVKNANN